MVLVQSAALSMTKRYFLRMAHPQHVVLAYNNLPQATPWVGAQEHPWSGRCRRGPCRHGSFPGLLRILRNAGMGPIGFLDHAVCSFAYLEDAAC